MLVSLTVGKVDAGVTVLLTEDKRVIEFPSILLPPDITSGSIVDVDVSRNFDAEQTAAKSFAGLQAEILTAFGSESPSAPVLRCRNATQTSLVLEWDPISLATADLRSLSLYRNGSKAGSIPRPLEMTSTKISGLAVDTEYTFSLVLRTSAGTFSSERLAVRTHKMTDLSGITVTPGIMAPELRTSLEESIKRMGAKLIDSVRIDTTHFVCTEGRGEAWKKATDNNVPVVVPDWVKACEHDGRIVGVRAYYLDADPKLRKLGPGTNLQRGDSTLSIAERPASQQAQPPQTHVTPPTPTNPEHAREDDDEDEDEDEERARDDQNNDPSNVGPQEDKESDQERDDSVIRKSPIEDHEEDEDDEDDESKAGQKSLEGSPGPAQSRDSQEDGEGMEDVKL